MTSLKVLITAASRRVPLIRAFQDALRELSVPGLVLVTDVNGLSPGVHVADRAQGLADQLADLLVVVDPDQRARGPGAQRHVAARVAEAVVDAAD